MYSVLADTKPIRAGCVDVRWDITEERSQMRSAASMTHSGGGGWPTSYITARWHRFPVPALVITSRPSVVPSARRHRVSILQHDPFRDPSEKYPYVPAAPLVGLGYRAATDHEINQRSVFMCVLHLPVVPALRHRWRAGQRAGARRHRWRRRQDVGDRGRGRGDRVRRV
jgi:hypothetical protein